MITAAELRCGNALWPLRVLDPQNIHPMGYYMSALSILRADSDNVQFNRDWAPIPITVDRLEKMGFLQVDSPVEPGLELQYWKHQKLSTIIYKGSNISHIHCDFSELPHVRYVHQLQNLYFALTGEEIEIDRTR